VIKNSLIQLLKTFSKKEMTRFYEFVQSPYHNKHQEVQALVGYLHKIYPQFTPKKCHRTKVFKVLFPKQAHDQANLALLFTYAFRLAKEFLAVEQYKAQEESQNLHLLTALRQKDQSVIYEKQVKQTQKSLNNSQFKGSPFYWEQYALAKETDLYFEPRSRNASLVGIQEKQAFLDYFYLSEKLKDACELEVRRQILRVESEVQFIDPILTTLQKDWQRYKNIPPIAVYYHLYRLITEEDTEQYYQALPIIEQNSRFFPTQELKDIYTYIQNYCIKKINQSDTLFMEELLKIYKIQLERETSLPTESRENAYRYNRAAYAYEEGDYDKVLSLLLQVEYTNIQYSLSARWLLLRTYYELAESIAFFALCDSFRLYLQRNQLIAAFKKKGHEQGIRLVKKAFQLKLDKPYQKKEKTAKELAKLRQEIMDTDTVFNRGWLVGKIGEL